MTKQNDPNCFGRTLIFSGLEFALTPAKAEKTMLGCLTHPDSSIHKEKIRDGWRIASEEEMVSFLDVSYFKNFILQDAQTKEGGTDFLSVYGNTNCCECSLVRVSCTDKSKTLAKIATEDIPSSAYLLLVKPV